MYSILVADDETIIREGIKFLFDYEALGFHICAEAATGDQALDMILRECPDVALLDIRMPGLTGLEVIQKARNQGYKGKVVIVSSYTDFKFAQEAIRYGVQNYITKPIDEDELKSILLGFRKAFDEENTVRAASRNYRAKARASIVRDILTGDSIPPQQQLTDLNLVADSYQVVIMQRTKEASDMTLPLKNPDNTLYDHIHFQGKDTLLLKGESAIRRFHEMMEFSITANRMSPELLPFFACSDTVSSLEAVPASYRKACTLLERRFLFGPEKHSLTINELASFADSPAVICNELVEKYASQLLDCIHSFNRRKIAETLKQLQNLLINSSDSTASIKLFLTDLYLLIKEKMHHLYPNSSIPYFSNAAIIRTIDEAEFLGDVIWFYTKRFEVFMDATGISTRDSVLDDILHYIQHNYASNITLENIAPLFGYNRSYLGKIFTKKMGQNFNSYVDFVRIEKSKELLLNADLKVYSIAERVGYKNVDYFHIKFKKYVGQSPAEFRKRNKISGNTSQDE